MLAAKFIRENTELVRQNFIHRRSTTALLDDWLSMDASYRELLMKSEALKAERNAFKPQGKPDPEQLSRMKTLSDHIKSLDEDISKLESQLSDQALGFPNMLSPDTPVGKDETDNPTQKTWGEPRVFNFTPLPHDELGVALNILDFERGTKLSGSRFTVLKGWGAKMERALINFMLETHSASGYEEVWTPFIVNKESMTGTGQLPKFEEELYRCERDELYLIPTAEVPVTNLFRDEIVSTLPMKFVAYTPCFRREAGSYGKDTAGLIRQHQFNKVELVIYTKPEESMDMLESLTRSAEHILELLELPYRRIQLCSGDVGFSSCKTYDLEVWFPSQGRYREISSCSNFWDFQARRAKIRYRNEDKQVEPIHTLNGSGLAVGRTLAAILENYQESNGSVRVPKVLQEYLKTAIINKD